MRIVVAAGSPLCVPGTCQSGAAKGRPSGFSLRIQPISALQNKAARTKSPSHNRHFEPPSKMTVSYTPVAQPPKISIMNSEPTAMQQEPGRPREVDLCRLRRPATTCVHDLVGRWCARNARRPGSDQRRAGTACARQRIDCRRTNRTTQRRRGEWLARQGPTIQQPVQRR
jgi:hypothetical protein